MKYDDTVEWAAFFLGALIGGWVVFMVIYPARQACHLPENTTVTITGITDSGVPGTLEVREAYRVRYQSDKKRIDIERWGRPEVSLPASRVQEVRISLPEEKHDAPDAGALQWQVAP